MAHIRTIKPDFFTSADIAGLTPLARLLYVGLWCEADREGRFVWNPQSWKLRYLPGDTCNIDSLTLELLAPPLVVRYGTAPAAPNGYGYIPTFPAHQQINNRERESVLPDPRVKHGTLTRHSRVTHASSTRAPRDEHAPYGKGREGKGMEGNGIEGKGEERAPRAPRGTRLPLDWEPPKAIKTWADAERPDLDGAQTVAAFRDYWCAKSGADAVKLDWDATYRNWVRKEREHTTARNGHTSQTGETPYQRNMRERMEKFAPSVAAKAPGARAVIDVETKNVVVPGRLG